MEYDTQISKELFKLFEGCKLVDILPDQEQKMMFVFDNGKTLRGVTFDNGSYEVQTLRKITDENNKENNK